MKMTKEKYQELTKAGISLQLVRKRRMREMPGADTAG